MRSSPASILVLMLLALFVPGVAQAQDRLDPTDVVLRAGDQLRIQVWPDSMLGGQYPVEETGLVYLPVLGEVVAAGRSISSLRTELRSGYRDAMRSPVVTITPLYRVTVIGSVQRPGVYWVDPTQNLFDVIGEAGGFSGNANEDDLRVIRGEEIIEIDASRVMEGGEAVLALQPRSGDRIMVPQRSNFTFSTLLTLAQTAAIIVSIVYR